MVEHKDNYGNLVIPGQLCFYNLSGEIAVGTVFMVRVPKLKAYRHVRFRTVVHIQMVARGKGIGPGSGTRVKPGHISKVKIGNIMMYNPHHIADYLQHATA